MSKEELERLDEAWLAALNRHDVEGYVGVFADEFAWHDWSVPEPMRDKETVRGYLNEMFRAFPDMSVKQTARVVGNDAIAAELEWTGTNTGPIALGENEMPPTNKPVASRGAYIAFVRDGKVVELRAYPDVAGMMMQLGFMPEA